MPKKEMDYSKCVIYKIQHKDNNDLLYVGHTTNFTKRKAYHKEYSTTETSSKYNNKVYQMIRENGGWLDFNMVIIKEFSCENRRQAEAEEDKIMREMKATMNTNRAFIEKGEYYLNNKDKIIQKVNEYRQNNIEHIREYDRERNKNPERKEQHKQSYEKHKEQRLKQTKQYRENNKEKIQERQSRVCLCPCGKEYTNHHKLRHEKSQFHRNFLNPCINTDPPSSLQPEPASS